MSVDIRLPNINAKTEAEQQIKSYLIQIVEQLNWALQNIDTSNNSAVVNPTPKSLQSSSQNTASPEATFGSIKALIIKSADIVNAYYDEINKRLVGEYVASSDYGTFMEKIVRDISDTASNTSENFEHIQQVQSDLTGIGNGIKNANDDISGLALALDTAKDEIGKDLEGIKDNMDGIKTSMIEVNANIKTGLLDYDNDIPIYGLEIGQRNKVDGVETFNKFARFTADRLSFYDQSGVEAAYISDHKLYIYNVEITGIYKIGGYVDTVMPNGDVITRWVGRG